MAHKPPGQRPSRLLTFFFGHAGANPTLFAVGVHASEPDPRRCVRTGRARRFTVGAWWKHGSVIGAAVNVLFAVLPSLASAGAIAWNWCAGVGMGT